MQIHWYPGHMVKTRKIIKEHLKLVDIVLELTDARAPMSSHIPDIDELVRNKDVITVLNKADLGDKKITDLWLDKFEEEGKRAIAVDTLSRRGFNKLLDLIMQTPSKKKKMRATRCMVIGVPNVGKSSIINQMARRKSAKTADVPGVTRSKMWLKVSNKLELLDTPGILWPKFEDKSIGIKLALLGCIKPELLNMEKLSLILIRFLSKAYPDALISRYKTDIASQPMDTLEQIARNRGFLISGGTLDIERSANTLLSEFRQGKLGGISLEKPDDKAGFWQNISNQDNI